MVRKLSTGAALGGQLDVTDENQIPLSLVNTKSLAAKKLCIYLQTGITIDSLTIHGKNEDFDKVLNTNLRGAYIFLREVGHFMFFKKRGKQFYISSVAAKRGGRGQLSYAASKE